jgi:excisionase family DNA binding protein
MTVSEVAEMCRVHPKTVARAIHRGELRAARLGARGAYRLRPSDVDAWIADRVAVARPALARFDRPSTAPVAGRLIA